MAYTKTVWQSGDIISATKETFQKVSAYFEKAEIRNAVSEIFEYISLANKYYDSREPWNQVKEDIDAFNETTYTCVYMMNNIANLIHPVLPNASKKIKDMLKFPEYSWGESSISGDYNINDLQILYNRIDEKVEN